MRRLMTALALGGALAASVPALAHGFLVSMRGEGTTISGRVYYSDGTPGAREFVELRDVTDASRPLQTGATDQAGAFRFTGVAGHRYALIAHGEEGHTTEMLLTLASGARGKLVDVAGPSKSSWAPPAWALIGGALLLSMLPALWLRRRGKAKAAR